MKYYLHQSFTEQHLDKKMVRKIMSKYESYRSVLFPEYYEILEPVLLQTVASIKSNQQSYLFQHLSSKQLHDSVRQTLQYFLQGITLPRA